MDTQELLARESIRATLARYTTAGDRLQVEEFKAVFTEDAVMESQEVATEDNFRYEGREAIGQWLQRWRDNATEPRTAATEASFVRHHLATCDITFVSPSLARVRTYWTAYTDIGPDHGGYYVDDLRRDGDQWLIAHRRVRLDWRAPNSLFTQAINRTR